MLIDGREYGLNLHGWNSGSLVFDELISQVKPAVIIEVGSWYGASAIHMIKSARGLGLDPILYCVDTWLGSDEHWEGYGDQLQLIEGFPTFYFQFLANIRLSYVSDSIITIPATSLQGARRLKKHKLKADLIYIDASHEEKEVYDDLKAYYPMLREGGILFGDDYRGWLGVALAVDHFAHEKNLSMKVRGDIFWAIKKEN